MEQWKDIVGYEWKYQINEIGEVKSLNFNHSGKECIMIPSKTWNWYLSIELSLRWERTTKQIHRLVAQAFIPNPENKPQVNHKNWIKTDNRVENLEWATASENCQHAHDTWLNKVTKKHHFYTNHPTKWKFWKDNHSSKKIYQYTLDWVLIKKWESWRDIVRELGINKSSLSRCCLLKQKSSGWYIWEYSWY